MDLKTIFDGWGTELISILVSLLLSGFGCWYFKRGKVNQKQKAGNNAKQKQEVKDSQGKSISQEQKAGNNSNQIQIG